MKKLLLPFITLCAVVLSATGCGEQGAYTQEEISDGQNITSSDDSQEETFINPGDKLGGGQTADSSPEASATEYSANIKSAIASTSEATEGESTVPSSATLVTANKKGNYKIESGGDYYFEGTLENNKINISATGVTLYLNSATLTNIASEKVITSSKDFTLTLIGENSVDNTDTTGVAATDKLKNAIDCDGTITINGGGTLSVNSAKNGIKGNAIVINQATLNITAANDGLHAEIDAYDGLTEEPQFSYEDGGYVYIAGGDVTIVSADDGIQADTFAYIKGGNVNITTNGGAPSKVTESSSNNVEGKGIKAGTIDWDDEGGTEHELSSGDYLILIEGGDITINSNDDAIHSNDGIMISGGTIAITSGDDGVHADNLLEVSGGTITITKSYEGIEGAKVEISGGTINVASTDDGINAADGTQTAVGKANTNCHIIVSGGTLYVNAEGDGIDSNGSMLFSGGTTIVMGPTSGDNAALDADGSIIVNGGYLFAAGPLGMVETPASNSGQNVISFAQNQALSSGTIISLATGDEELLSVTLKKSSQSIIISCPEITIGTAYTLYGGDTKLATFTVSETITKVGSSQSITTPGGTPGNNGGNGNPRPGFGGWTR